MGLGAGTALVSCFFIVFSIVDLSYAVTHAEMDQLGVACNGTKADIEVMKQYLVPKTETGKCLMKCLTDYYGMFDSEGKYNTEKTEKSLLSAWSDKPKEHMLVIAKHCETLMKDEPASNYKTCQISYNAMECINKKAWELGWFFK